MVSSLEDDRKSILQTILQTYHLTAISQKVQWQAHRRWCSQHGQSVHLTVALAHATLVYAPREHYHLVSTVFSIKEPLNGFILQQMYFLFVS